MSEISQNDAGTHEAAEQHEPTLMLVDGHALFHRAFHAFPEDMSTQAGEPTNAIFGFARMLLDALKNIHPDYAAVAFDRPTPTFRHLEFDSYKAQRPPLPEFAADDLKSGSWAGALIALVEPYTARLAALLGRAWPPNAAELRGHPSASERIEAALRTLDRAALDLGRVLDRAEVDGPKLAAAREKLAAHNASVAEQERHRAARAALSNI